MTLEEALVEPIAYLIRENRSNMAPSIMCGKMFKSRKAAEAAAERLTNRWRTCTVVPVKEIL